MPNLQLKDFAVWGGSSSASIFSPAQGIFIGNKVSVEGSLGSNHQIDAKNNFTLTGNIYSGNRISFVNAATIAGNVSAERKDLSYQAILVAAGTGSRFNGNISANGKVEIKIAEKCHGISIQDLLKDVRDSIDPLLVRRKRETIKPIEPDFILELNDSLVLSGSLDILASIAPRL